MLDLAILGLLSDQPRHGYELKRALLELGFRRVSFGSLYPALRRLERRGYIEVAAGSSGRRKAYAVTAAGSAELGRLLADGDAVEGEDERAFTLRLAFFRHLDPPTRIGLLERRRDGLVDRLPEVARPLRAQRRTRQTIDRYRAAVLEHLLRVTQDDIAWLDGLIAAERSDPGRTAAPMHRRPAISGGENP